MTFLQMILLERRRILMNPLILSAPVVTKDPILPLKTIKFGVRYSLSKSLGIQPKGGPVVILDACLLKVELKLGQAVATDGKAACILRVLVDTSFLIIFEDTSSN